MPQFDLARQLSSPGLRLHRSKTTASFKLTENQRVDGILTPIRAHSSASLAKKRDSNQIIATQLVEDAKAWSLSVNPSLFDKENAMGVLDEPVFAASPTRLARRESGISDGRTITTDAHSRSQAKRDRRKSIQTASATNSRLTRVGLPPLLPQDDTLSTTPPGGASVIMFQTPTKSSAQQKDHVFVAPKTTGRRPLPREQSSPAKEILGFSFRRTKSTRSATLAPHERDPPSPTRFGARSARQDVSKNSIHSGDSLLKPTSSKRQI